MTITSPTPDRLSGEAPTTPAIAAIRVLVVDDQPLIRRGLALILGSHPDIEIVGEAGDGAEALTAARALTPDIVLMDLVMPGVGGVEATRSLAASCPGAQVVVLTTFDADDLVLDAIRAGAQAYLLKDASEADVLDTIRAVHRGESRLADLVARKVFGEIRKAPTAGQGQAAGAERAGDAADVLTRREEEILERITQGMSNKEIGRSLNLAEGTVKNYVSRIMDKLDARTRTELAVKAIGDKKT
jgi:DNA-binding NarL/FixJ family response regulator